MPNSYKEASNGCLGGMKGCLIFLTLPFYWILKIFFYMMFFPFIITYKVLKSCFGTNNEKSKKDDSMDCKNCEHCCDCDNCPCGSCWYTY
jgi:hypothetical protein